MRTRAFAVLAALVLAASPALAAEATLLSFEGKVQYKERATAEWKDARPGAALGVGSEILTGSNSVCRVRIGSADSAVSIHQDSRAVITSLDPVNISLESGRLFALVNNLSKGSSFQVRTPTAIAAARGTGWGQDADTVKVFEDTVDVRGTAGGQKDVGEGQGIEIGDDGTLGDTFELSDADKGQWKDFISDVSDGGSEADKDDGSDGPGLDDAGLPETFMSDMLDSKDQTSQASDEKDFASLKAETKDDQQGGY